MPANEGSVDFPTPASAIACSACKCVNGHTWPPTMVVATCKGCNTSRLMIQQMQCPYCNEPVEAIEFGFDIVPRGAGLAKRCCGESVMGEGGVLTLQPTRWREVESAPAKAFEAKVAEERSTSGGSVT